MPTTYALPSEVISFLRLRSTTGRLTLASTTDPASDEVTLSINIAEDQVDRITGHAWRSITVNSEFHDVEYDFATGYSRELAVALNHRVLYSLSSGTDKIEVWDGISWVECVSTKTEGRNNDFWMDYTNGIIYFRGYRPIFREKGVCATYRYGYIASIPYDIRKATILLAAIDLVENDIYKTVLPSGVNSDSLLQKTERWRKDLDRILAHRLELVHGQR